MSCDVMASVICNVTDVWRRIVNALWRHDVNDRWRHNINDMTSVIYDVMTIVTSPDDDVGRVHVSDVRWNYVIACYDWWTA